MTGSNYALPRLDTPEKSKDAKYHEEFARAILNRSVDDSWRNNWMLISECYKFLEEGSSGELVSHLQKAEDNSDLPAVWLSLNKIPTKIDLLIGELETRGFDLRVRALNKEAVSRKQERKEELRVKRSLQPLFQTADNNAGLPTGPTEYVPQSEEDLNEYMDLKYKDKAELIMGGALKWTTAMSGFPEDRKAMFRDVLASGRTWAKSEIVRGIPRPRRVHPLNMIFDTSAKRDDLTDATFFGELEYLPFASAAERYNLTDSELEEVYNSYQTYLGTNASNEAVMAAADYSYSFDTIGGKRLLWFKNVDGELRVLVTRAVWRDTRVIRHKDEVKQPYGSEHFQKIPDADEISGKDKDKIVTRKMECWRQCTIIGGHIIREWGECLNQPRSINDLGPTEPPYKAWIPNFSTGRGVSKVEQLAAIQLYKDILLYNMQLAVLRAGAKGFAYDLAMKPDTMSIDQMMKYLKVSGITYYNSKDAQFLPGSNTSPFKELDMSMSDSVGKYVDLMTYLDGQMDEISGISPARQGAVQGASQGLGVTQAAVFQSNLITQPYFVGFERFCSRILTHQAKLIKISFSEDKERFAPIIGDVGVDFLRDNFDIEFEEFGVVVESLPPLIQDRTKFEQLVWLAAQSDPRFAADALNILLEPDIRVAVRKFQKRAALREMFEAKQAQMQQQADADLQERLQGLESENRMREMEARLKEIEAKNEGGLKKSMVTGRIKLGSDQIKAQTKMAELNMQKQLNQQNNEENDS
jgi:hypothetical protein